MISLAVEYRPKTFEDVIEQDYIVKILTLQMKNSTVKSSYLFVGPAGTGKTTVARILANDLNGGKGNAIEIDAASNTGVDDVRNIIEQSKMKSIISEYKIFIIDECHSLSNQAWQAFLKLLEEPPINTVFIFCTTDPQKIPNTIFSRVQRFDFKRLSTESIINNLNNILNDENLNWKEKYENKIIFEQEALEYIAKIASGGMRDAITLLEKCLSYSTEINIQNVVNCLGVVNYNDLIDFIDFILNNDAETMVKLITALHIEGKDLNVFIKSCIEFVVDIIKYNLTKDLKFTKLPNNIINTIDDFSTYDINIFYELLDMLVKLQNDIKYDNNPKMFIEVKLLLFMRGIGINNETTTRY